MHRDINYQVVLRPEDLQIPSHLQCNKRILSLCSRFLNRSFKIVAEQQDLVVMCNSTTLPRYAIDKASA